MELEDQARTPSAEETADAMSKLLEADAAGTPLRDLFEVPDTVLNLAESVAHRLYKQGDYERAEQLMRGVIALDDERSYAHLLLGDILLKSSLEIGVMHPDQALEAKTAFERTLELDATSAVAAVKLARLHIRSGDRDRAASLLGDVVANTDDDALRSEARVLLERLTG